MERCHICSKPATIELTYLKKMSCNRCLFKINYKRFRNEIRGVKKVSVTKEDKPSFYLMEHFLEKANIDYTFSPKGKVKSTSQDELVEMFFESVFRNKKFKLGGLLPMSGIPDREINQLNDYLKIKSKVKKRSKISKQVDDIEIKRPGARFSVVKLIKQINEL